MTRQPFSVESPQSKGDSPRYVPVSSQNILELNRIYRCSRSALYKYFAEPEKLVKWMPQKIEGSLSPGSEAKLIWNGNTEVVIEVQELEPERKISFRMVDANAVNTRVILKFHNHEQYSFLRLSHLFPAETVSNERILNLRRKWTFFLDNLVSVLEHRFDLRALKSEEDGWRWLQS